MTQNNPKSNRRGFLEKWLSNRKLRSKFLILAGINLIFILVIGTVGVQSYIQSNNLNHDLINNDFVLESSSQKLQELTIVIASSFREFVLRPKSDALDIYNQTLVNVSNIDETVFSILDPAIGEGWATKPRQGFIEAFTDFNRFQELGEGNQSEFGLFDTIFQRSDLTTTIHDDLQNLLVDFDGLVNASKGYVNQTDVHTRILQITSNIQQGVQDLFLFGMDFEEQYIEYPTYIFSLEGSDGITGINGIPIIENLELLNSSVSGNSTLLSNFENIYNKIQLFLTRITDYFTTLKQVALYLERIEDLQLEMTGELTSLVVIIKKNTDGEIQENDQTYQQRLLLTISAIIASVILSFALSILFSRLSIRPVKGLIKQTQKISTGDLTGGDYTSFADQGDEIGNLNSHFDIMAKELRKLVFTVTSSSESLQISSDELASASEETSAAMEEVTGTSQSMSQGASIQAEMISSVVEDLMHLGETIVNVTDQVKDNSSIISQIALQTNILALNAGIEASRAGDYGRGFAVVAENVRRLSEESKSASERITEVASTISEQLDDGFGDIRKKIEEIASVAEETAASAEEVSAAAEEVTSSVEQVTSLSQKLSSESLDALNQIKKYKID